MSAKATLSGIITDIFPVETFGNFEKRVFWLKETDAERFPEHYSVECHQGDVNILDNFKTGQHVKVQIDIRGKKWSKNGKDSVFVTLKAWKIETADASNSSQPASAQASRNQNSAPTTQSIDEPLDDLPF